MNNRHREAALHCTARTRFRFYYKLVTVGTTNAVGGNLRQENVFLVNYLRMTDQLTLFKSIHSHELPEYTRAWEGIFFFDDPLRETLLSPETACKYLQ